MVNCGLVGVPLAGGYILGAVLGGGVSGFLTSYLLIVGVSPAGPIHCHTPFGDAASTTSTPGPYSPHLLKGSKQNVLPCCVVVTTQTAGPPTGWALPWLSM